MGEHAVPRRISLKSRHHPTGKTRHFREGSELSAPVALEIARYAEDSSFYLFYLYAAGVEITDTNHESLEDAMSQTEWEFGVGEDEWLVPSSEKAV